MSKKVSPNSITSLAEDWANDVASGLPFSGQAVQEFIKSQLGGLDTTVGKKVGYICPSPTTDTRNYYHIWGFAEGSGQSGVYGRSRREERPVADRRDIADKRGAGQLWRISVDER